MQGSLGERFGTDRNALNLVRLALAVQVILWHSYTLRGGNWLPAPAARLFGDVAIDGFFAVSGFLICRAWMRRPRAGAYLRARAARILPGLWVCLTLTALVLVPAVDGPVTRSGQWAYIWRSGTFSTREWVIDGSPHGLPDPSWDGSLWSLRYEVLCYLVVLVLGLAALLTRQVLLGLAVFAWSAALVMQLVGLSAYSVAWFWQGPWVGFSALSIACTLPIAMASWVLIERRALRLARGRTSGPALAQPLERRIAPPSAVHTSTDAMS